MGFCRRCGDIVVGPRCKCGGTSVAPVVKWNQGDVFGGSDRWSRTYVTRETSHTPPTTRTSTSTEPIDRQSTGSRRFPRPMSTNQGAIPSQFNSRISAHIASATVPRPPSPLKYSTSNSADLPSYASAGVAADILPNPQGSELAKVYGSVLQPKETLSGYNCALCATPFPPDATIYPDPECLSTRNSIDNTRSTRFLCKSCFVSNGGSKGDCPSCQRPVLILKSEGGFVESGGKVWHKKCFICEGCSINIGDHPMVDLLGRPTCADCFETCLTRSSKDVSQSPVVSTPNKNSNLGGTRRKNKSRESSPALEELEQRLGIIKSRENTPANDKTERFETGMKSSASPNTRSPASSRYSYSSNNMEEDNKSPLAERIARARANSLIGNSSPFSLGGDDSHFTSRSPRLMSPDPDDRSDGSPAPRRTLNRFRSPGPDNSSPVTKVDSSSPRGSPISSPKPSEHAIEEMKRRFLRQSSPSPNPTPVTESPTQRTPTRRSTSRARMPGTPTSLKGTPRREEAGDFDSSEMQSLHTLRGSSSMSSLRSSLRQDRTGDTDYTIRRDQTGETDIGPSRDMEIENAISSLRRDRTGDAEVESLIGVDETTILSDLIDLSSPERPPSGAASTGAMSRIPLPTRISGSSSQVISHNRLNIRKSTSSSSLSRDYNTSVPPTPDLADFSDTTSNTPSSGPSTPPSASPPSRRDKGDSFDLGRDNSTSTKDALRTFNTILTTPTSKSKANAVSSPTPLSTDARCAKCNLPLFSVKNGGKFVTVPEETSVAGIPPKTYHTTCFTCKECGGSFQARDGGLAVFVRTKEGACHVECAPAQKINVRQIPSTIPKWQPPPAHKSPNIKVNPNVKSHTYASSSSRYEPPPTTAPPTTTSFTFPRFGGSSSCPGCHKAVVAMERGVVQGPQGTKWHGGCLICGGQEAKGRRKEPGKPGCGKKLDSAAKTDIDGKVWCRECLLLLPMSKRQASPVREPIVPSTTGSRGAAGQMAPQFTGTTTLARQFTGVGGGDAALARQMTGGGLSPTRQLTSSPTKLYDGPRPGLGRMFPRPKSVTGVRSIKGDGEGRGMFLVRQLTGGNGSFSGNDYGL